MRPLFRRRVGLVAVVALIALVGMGLVLAIVSPTPAHADQSAPTLSPGQAPPGSQVIASASDWTGCTSMTLSGWGRVLASAAIDASGAFSLPFTVPSDASVGAVQLQFSPSCSHSAWMPFVSFNVTTGSPSPPSPPPPGPLPCGGDVHCYVTAKQSFDTPTAHGVGAFFTAPVSLPQVHVNDYSVGQLALVSTSPIFGKAIEFGWIVSPGNWEGDQRPHLFVALRFNTSVPGASRGTCFVGVPGQTPCSDYVQLSMTMKPGDVVQSGDTPMMYHVGYYAPDKSWWIQYGSEWIGKVYESHWGSSVAGVGGFAKGNEIQWYGESVFSANTCTPMGNGLRGSDASSTSISKMFYETMQGEKSVAIDAGASISESDRRYWDSGNLALSGSGIDGFHYGGPGKCF